MRTCAFLIAVLVAVLPGSLFAADFVGAESCKACHPEAYAAWKASKHARAFESLTSQQKQDARCTSCHAPNEREQGLPGISCETCHGGGQYYSPEYVMKDSELSRLVGLNDPSEKQCRSCHDASSPSLRPFDFVEKLKLIDHWTAERERRKSREPEKKAVEKPAKKKAEVAHPRLQQVVAAAAAFRPSAP